MLPFLPCRFATSTTRRPDAAVRPLVLTLNQASFRSGEMLRVDVTVTNAGSGGLVDVWSTDDSTLAMYLVAVGGIEPPTKGL